ncbi:IS3 family transposase [Paenibacillaceae bacterium]|nr:IS3 family transposase [Paenibacillaceae bacterium]
MEKMCKVMEVSRSGYYKWSHAQPSAQALRKAMVQERIVFHFHDSFKRYGAPKITQLLLREGYPVTERTVGTYMAELGLRSCVSRKYKVQTTDSNHDYALAPNLLNQQFHVEKPGKVWVADITFIPCREGRLYLASVMDLCTREIVGWKLGSHMKTELVLDDALKEYNMTASMSRRGNCYDNASMESFHSILKKEFIYCTRFRTKQQAYDGIFHYIEFFYNRKRIHGSLGYVSPVRFATLFEQTA